MKDSGFEDIVLLVYNYVAIYRPELDDTNLHISDLANYILNNSKLKSIISSGFGNYGIHTSDYFMGMKPEFSMRGNHTFVKLIFVVWYMLKGLSYQEAVQKLKNLYSMRVDYINSINVSEVECEECWGEGDVQCEWCDGDGGFDCGYCEGGQVECSECDGSGKDEDGEDCYYCEGEGTKNCDNCDGDGKVECDECDGGGRVNCDNCDSSGNLEKPGYSTVGENRVLIVADMSFMDSKIKNKLESQSIENISEITPRFEYFLNGSFDNYPEFGGLFVTRRTSEYREFKDSEIKEKRMEEGDIINKITIEPFK